MEENKKNKISAYPLSFAQQRIWFLSKLESKSLSYNIGSLVAIPEFVDVKLMQSVFDELIQKHEVLRTNFIETDKGEPVQIIHKEKANKIVFYDLSQAKDKRKKRKEIIKENSDYLFDLSRDSLARICLVKTAEDKYDFLMVVHHIISDIWSLLIFGNEFFHLYNQKKNKLDKVGFEISQSATQYRDYAAWQQSAEFFDKVENEKKYWLKQLQGDLPVLDLPTDRPRPFLQTYDIKTVTLEIGEELSTGVNNIAKQNNVTVYVFLLTVFKVLLFDLTRQSDLIVGTYAANRDLPELDGVMGVFLNNLALRSQINPQENFSDLLLKIKETVLLAMENKDYPFEKLIEDLNIPRDMGRSPIFNTVFQMFTDDDRLKMNFYGSRGENQDVFFDNGTSQFDLTLKVFIGEKKIFLVLDYNTYLFQKETTKRFLNYYKNLLEIFINDTSLKIAQVNIFSEDEEQKLLEIGKGEKNNFSERSILDLFEKKVEETPNEEALVFKNKRYTYQELNSKVNQTARYFRKKGITPEAVVGLFLERSDWYLITLLALLKLGAIYIPLDISQPKNRIDFILADSRAGFIISDRTVTVGDNISNVVLAEDQISSFLKDNLEFEISKDDLAYIIYTSGSTGKPKGVKITHLALANFVLSMFSDLKIKKERVLASTNVIFDIFFLEAIAPLCWGSKVFLLDDRERLDLDFVKKYIIEKEISLVQFTPSFLSLLLGRDNSFAWLGKVSKLLVGGEAWGADLLSRIQKNFPNKIYNLYGPSETTIWSSVADLSISKKVYLGKAIANTDIYILDNNLKPCPSNIIGEIYIGGDGLAEAYTNKEETTKKFISNPFGKGRIYKTGDLAKYLVSGEIEYCGRIDDQVKINGRRIELEEISSELKKNIGINECVVLFDKDEPKRLVAYYTSEVSLDVEFLRVALVEKLPEYMIPSAFIFFDRFPLTANGKINRQALLGRFPILFSSSLSREPQGEIENGIALIWQEVLKVEKINVHDNFFQLGGNSLDLIQVYSRLREVFSQEINIAELFSYPNIYALSQHLKNKTREDKEEKKDYRESASNLIDRVAIGKISAEEAAKIFAKI